MCSDLILKHLNCDIITEPWTSCRGILLPDLFLEQSKESGKYAYVEQFVSLDVELGENLVRKSPLF